MVEMKLTNRCCYVIPQQETNSVSSVNYPNQLPVANSSRRNEDKRPPTPIQNHKNVVLAHLSIIYILKTRLRTPPTSPQDQAMQSTHHIAYGIHSKTAPYN